MPRLIEVELPESMIRSMGAHMDAARSVRVFRFGPCSVMVGREPLADEGLRYHMSISHPRRLPDWNEIKAAKRALEQAGLLPADRTYVMPFPPSTAWISLHDNCFHLWELRNDEIAAHWAEEGHAARRVRIMRP